MKEQLDELESKQAEVKKMKQTLESNRVRLAEAYVEWKVSSEMGSSSSRIKKERGDAVPSVPSTTAAPVSGK